jgi:hypothetical protein
MDISMRLLKMTLENIKKTNDNSDGLIKCLQPTQDSFTIHPKIYALKSVSFIKFCGTPTVSSPGTASLGWLADALVPCFLLSPRLFHRDTKVHYHLSGPGTI